MAKFVCQARQYSDQTICTRCDMTWDVNDPEPPNCKTGRELYNYVKEKLKWLNRKSK